jgi:hypothetical protein
MGRLRGALQSTYKDKDEDVKVYTPRNTERLEIAFRGERVAKVSSTGSKSFQWLTQSGYRHFGSGAAQSERTHIRTARRQGLLIYVT